MSQNFNQKILILEEQLSLRQLYHQSLKGEGYEVFAVPNVHEALNIFEREMPQVLIYDMFQPGNQLMNAISKMKDYKDDFYVVSVSDPVDTNEYIDGNLVDAFVRKTGDLKHLKQILRDLLT